MRRRWVVHIVTFNQKEHVVAGADEEAECYLDLHTRDDSTSRWLKRDFDLDGKTVDLKAQTYDAVFYNNSVDQVES